MKHQDDLTLQSLRKNGKTILARVTHSYFNVKESSVPDSTVMYGSRVVTLSSLRNHVTDILHAAHQGVSKIPQRTQISIFWPGLKKHIEDKCMLCGPCMSADRNSRKQPLLQYPIPDYPFQ